MATTYRSREAVYSALWDRMAIHRDKLPLIEERAQRIIANNPHYELVSMITSVPWYVVGIIHSLEADLSFALHLHNGDPLTAQTVRVPAGRPPYKDGPFTWEESACDALALKKLSAVSSWTIERIAYELERYNGFGYVPKPIYSPYLWSYTNNYTKGKFVKDGVYNPDAVSKQCGGMALLRILMAFCDDVRPDREPRPDDTPMV
jgi:lysozyme family protein